MVTIVIGIDIVIVIVIVNVIVTGIIFTTALMGSAHLVPAAASALLRHSWLMLAAERRTGF